MTKRTVSIIGHFGGGNMENNNDLTIEKVSILRKWYNVYRFLWVHKLCLLSKIIWKMSYLLFGCCVPPTVVLEEGVNFSHPIGIVIHQNPKVGKNTFICQNVTIGRKDGNPFIGPVVGSDCLIGAGACILGDIKIGNHVKVGANAVVLHDVPDNCTVVGVPAKIIKEKIKINL